MQKITLYTLILLTACFVACDNEVELNAEYEDTTVIYGLLNANKDTQFVKVNRAFLEDGVSAIELAQQSDRFFYDSLDVTLFEEGNGDTIELIPISVPKADGVFANDRNIVYYTVETLNSLSEYQIEVKQADGKRTTATTTILEDVQSVRPEVLRPPDTTLRSVAFVRNVGGLQYQDYDFILRFTPNIAEVQLNLYFQYEEDVDGAGNAPLEPRSIKIPVGGVRNTELENKDQEIVLPGELFYRALANAVDGNTNKKVVPLDNNIILEIIAVDPIFSQYTSVYGPLDGLAQVRPEFTNVTNGVGLFASQSTYRNLTFLSQDSRTELLTGPITGGLGFSNP